MPSVWVAGAGMTRIGRRTEALPDLMAEAAHAALAAAALDVPDAIVVATMERIGVDGLVVSEYGLREGIMDAVSHSAS